MQFSVPQFIDIEDKIFGPLTLKQFIYVIGGAGAAFILYSLFPLYIAIFFIIPIGILAFLLAFKPVHGRPFSVVLEAAFKYVFGSKLYLWKKERKRGIKTEKIKIGRVEEAEPTPEIPKVIEGKLDEMALGLDISDKTKNI